MAQRIDCDGKRLIIKWFASRMESLQTEEFAAQRSGIELEKAAVPHVQYQELVGISLDGACGVTDRG